ncbi:TPA: hypothetical protein N0F65_008491 [Lagenidium giganteum]|uniref:EF-hand domain-containing protein n=1 Tax=Lagenidium giganteum TaxID=4803 RepID=A0AAV2Z1K4_9STRA|nr:TPA: hypothetical protein N0F65_008491 [Lagenidium giganteum]
MTSMYASYNKNNSKGTLVGNWVEEEALRSTTGFSRRKVPGSVFAPDFKETRFEATQERVLLHADRPEVPFETTSQTYAKHGDGIAAKPISGPRSSEREAELLRQAKLTHQREQAEREAALKTTNVSTTKSSFLPLDTAALTSITRVPRGKNGSRVVDPHIQHLTKGEVDSIDQMQLQLLHQTGGAYDKGVTVTRYSHAVATATGLDFPISVSNSPNPFARSTAFTNEITDTTKRHGEATEPGPNGSRDQRLGTSIHQRTALNKFVSQIMDMPPSSAAPLLVALEAAVQNDVLQLNDFRAVFHQHQQQSSQHLRIDTRLSEREVIHLFMYFDVDSIGAVRWSDVRAYLDEQTRTRQ